MESENRRRVRSTEAWDYLDGLGGGPKQVQRGVSAALPT